MSPRLVLSIFVVLVACKRDRSAETQATDVVSRVQSALGEAAAGATVTLSADDVLSVRRGEWGVEVRLDNIRRSCASSPAECDGAIAGAVALTKMSLAATTAGRGSGSSERGTAPLDKALIRLTPKPDEWLASADQDVKGRFPDKFDDNRVVRTAFAADLKWLYVSDEPSGMRMLTQRDLKELGLTVEELHALAIKNLAGQYPALGLTELAPGVWTMEPGDYLDSARLALTDQWRAEAKKRGGTLVATVPGRSRVFVSNDPKARPALDKITATAFGTEDHALSTAVLEWTDTGWKAAR